MSKEDFKNYVRNNYFVKEGVDRGDITWQKAYEAYDLQGENAMELLSLKKEEVVLDQPQTSSSSSSFAPTSPLLLTLASLDWNQISHAVDNLSRMVGMAKDMTAKDDSKVEKAQSVFRRYND